ncbi:uncharacterized protein [Littorina saxatilis]|uniref:uncharacterized protein n=1 Tax=Littorina saxatilis TaxID=31220 RepID=UPI0038B53BB8
MGPSPFTTDGTKNLNLTCVATDVFPSPQFIWAGLCASSTDTCTFMPQPNQTGQPVICSVTNAFNSSLGTQSASFCLDLEYPPPEAPGITTNINTTVLSSGDSLTCTVRGGKPVVTSVHFYCTNPPLSDQEDVTEDTSVSSSVVVDTAKATNASMHCHCSAVWDPEPDLYAATYSDMTFLLDLSRAPLAEDITTLLIAGCGAAGGVFIIMSVVIIVCICRCKRGPHASKHSARTDERPDSCAESIMIRNSAYESASVFELSLGPVRTTSLMEPAGHYASVGPAEPSNKAARTQAYEDVGYAVAGTGLDARSVEQPHRQPTTVPTVSPAPENNVYAVVNKSRKK